MVHKYNMHNIKLLHPVTFYRHRRCKQTLFSHRTQPSMLQPARHPSSSAHKSQNT